MNLQFVLNLIIHAGKFWVMRMRCCWLTIWLQHPDCITGCQWKTLAVWLLNSPRLMTKSFLTAALWIKLLERTGYGDLCVVIRRCPCDHHKQHHKQQACQGLPASTEQMSAHFFDNLLDVCQRYKFQLHQIYNVDETGIQTVHSPGKVIAERGAKMVGQVTSAERGTLVTVCCTINAIGTFLPPVFIFPHVYFKNAMLNNAPPGSAGRKVFFTLRVRPKLHLPVGF